MRHELYDYIQRRVQQSECSPKFPIPAAQILGSLALLNRLQATHRTVYEYYHVRRDSYSFHMIFFCARPMLKISCQMHERWNQLYVSLTNYFR